MVTRSKIGQDKREPKRLFIPNLQCDAIFLSAAVAHDNAQPA